MFTGLVEGIGKILTITGSTEKYLLVELPPHMSNLKQGESIALDGICLTVESFTDTTYTCYASAQTVQTTTLQYVRQGIYVNLERALLPTTRLGGHFVTGHIDGTVQLLEKKEHGDSYTLRCSLPQSLVQYIVKKGSIALHGISLTVNDVSHDSCKLTIIPETHKMTTIQYWKVGMPLNIEVDILAKYVENMMRRKEEGITESFLQEHGFWK